MATLFEITKQYREDLEKLNDMDLPNEVVLDTVEAMQADLETKIRAVVAYARELEKIADLRRDEAKRMVDGAKAMENRAESLLSYVQAMVQASGIALPLRYPEFTVNLAKLPTSCEVTNAKMLPMHMVKSTVALTFQGYMTNEGLEQIVSYASNLMGATPNAINLDVSADKREVLSELKAGTALEGAKLTPVGYRLSVR